jgi:hypothetical protein
MFSVGITPNELDVAQILSANSTEDSHLKSVFLYSSEHLVNSEYDEPTLRVNGDIMSIHTDDIKYGTLFANEGQAQAQISFETRENFPDDPRAQAILAGLGNEIESGQHLMYTMWQDPRSMFEVDENLSAYSGESVEYT